MDICTKHTFCTAKIIEIATYLHFQQRFPPTFEDVSIEGSENCIRGEFADIQDEKWAIWATGAIGAFEALKKARNVDYNY